MGAEETSSTASKHGLRDKIREKVDHLQSDISRLGVAVSTTWNPNHRHDDPWEKEVDDKLLAIRDGHRFRSFAPERTDNVVKWHIDGHGKLGGTGRERERQTDTMDGN